MRTTRTRREKTRRGRRRGGADALPSYLLPVVPEPVVFDSSLRRAGDAVGRG